MKKQLPNVTLICVACIKHGESITAMQKCLEYIEPARAVFITDITVLCEGIECVVVPPLETIEDYSRFIIKELYKYFDTDYVLICQHDGYVLDASMWSDEFFDYDYIGAPWLDNVVGNGGASLRSKRLQTIIANDEHIKAMYIEDVAICRLYREYLEKHHDLKFAPLEVANRFAYELHPPAQPTFMFHGYFHSPFKAHIVIKRSGAIGDVILAEPLFNYYSEKGYQVVLDMPQAYMGLFQQYPHKLLHLSQMDSRIKPERYIDLDMAYERKPKQLALQSYYEAAGITDANLRNSILCFPVDHTTKLFKKYALLHIDHTGVEERNVRGISWPKVVAWLQAQGYVVFQIGQGAHEEVAPLVNTRHLAHLSYWIAGADLVIAVDSGPANISIALDVPTVVLYGNVNYKYRIYNTDRVEPLWKSCIVPQHQFCYHNTENSVVGTSCVINKQRPPCTVMSFTDVQAAVQRLLKKIGHE